MRHFIVYWLPVILCAGLIFSFSNQPYEKQDLRSDLSDFLDLQKVEKNFSGVQFEYSGKEISVQSLGASGFIEFFIRKGAHVTIYLVLGALIYRALVQHKTPSVRKMVLAVFLSFLYASSDEFHQSLTPNRTPLLQDVLLDTIGAVIGVWMMVCFYKVRKK